MKIRKNKIHESGSDVLTVFRLAFSAHSRLPRESLLSFLAENQIV
jgi:hypothetical protein